MLRLNIRCLNNQARFDPRRLPRGDERKKDRERKKEGEREKSLFKRAREWTRGAQRNENYVEDEKKRERKRRRRRFRFRPSGNRTRSLPFLVFDPRQILLPTTPLPPLLLVCSPPRPPLTLRQTSRKSLRRVFSLAVLTLSVYTYYAKQVTVGGLGSQTRSV